MPLGKTEPSQALIPEVISRYSNFISLVDSKSNPAWPLSVAHRVTGDHHVEDES